jgi:hypothetical protein
VDRRTAETRKREGKRHKKIRKSLRIAEVMFLVKNGLRPEKNSV